MDKSRQPGPENGGEQPLRPDPEKTGATRVVRLHVHRPGDRVIRTHRDRAYHLRRILGVPALFSVGYGDVGSSIFYALGLVAVVALGATPLVLGIAGIFFVFTALTYAEGTSMFPEAGGSSSFARHGFNDVVAFIAGWALMFSYIITVSISAFTVPHYLAYFWPVLKQPHAAIFFSMALVLFLMVVNVIGIRESGRLNLSLIGLDLITEILMVVTALVLFFNAKVVWHRMVENWPSTSNIVFGVAIATVAFTGIESISQLAGEAKDPQRRVPKALGLMMFTVLGLFTAIAISAFSVMSPVDLAGKWEEDAVAGVANSIYNGISPTAWAAGLSNDLSAQTVLAFFANLFRSLFPILIALMGSAILIVATNAGLIGISRTSFSLAENHSLPPLFAKVHSKFKTPYMSIIVFAVIAMVIIAQGLIVPDIFTVLGGLYAFGSMASFSLAHASILALRAKQPDRARPFKLRLSVKIKGRDIPLTAVFGLLFTTGVWIVIMVVQPYSRYFGLAWMGVGIVLYVLFRRSKGYSLTHHVQTHSRPASTVQRPADSLRPPEPK
ncbi:MAG: APC family permease [Dehalococcoidia bacterium]|nr:APC family permease [Dehalococcoidia bacterium]